MRVKEKRSLKESGSALIEYAILAGLISVVSIAALRVVGQKINNQFVSISNSLGGDTPLDGSDTIGNTP